MTAAAAAVFKTSRASHSLLNSPAASRGRFTVVVSTADEQESQLGILRIGAGEEQIESVSKGDRGESGGRRLSADF